MVSNNGDSLLRASTLFRLTVIILSIIVVGISIRQIPYQEFAFAPSHFRFGRYSTITITADSGFIQEVNTLPSIANLRVSVKDAWALLTFHSVTLNILGLDKTPERYWYFQNIIAAPLLIGSCLLLLCRRLASRSPIWVQTTLFIMPWLGGLLFLNGSKTSLLGFGYGSAMFIFAITALIQIELSYKPHFWALLAIITSLLALGFRHTIGLILIICFIMFYFGTFYVPLRNSKVLRLTAIISISIHILHSVIIFDFYATTIASGALGVFELLQTLFSDTISISQTQQSATPGGSGVKELELRQVLSAIDHLLVSTIVGILSSFSLFTLYSAKRNEEFDWRLAPIDSDIRGLWVVGLMSTGLLGGLIAFTMYYNLKGVIFRMTQYITLFSYISSPILISLRYSDLSREKEPILSENSRKLIYNSTIILILLLCFVSPAAFLISPGPVSSSQYMTVSEAHGTSTLKEYISNEDRIFGSYQIAPPLAETHNSVVGVGFRRFTDEEISQVLQGLYYSPSSNSTPRSIQILESEYGNIDIFLFSSRESRKLGVHTRARQWPSASKDHRRALDSRSQLQQIYSNGGISAYKAVEK